MVTNGSREYRMPTPVRNMPSQLQAGHTRARAHRWPSGLHRWRCCFATTIASRFAPASPSPWHSTWNLKLRQKQASPSGCAESGIAAAADRKNANEATFAPIACKAPTPVGSAQPAKRTVGSPKESITKTNQFGEGSSKATPVDRAKAEATQVGDTATPVGGPDKAVGSVIRSTATAPAEKMSSGKEDHRTAERSLRQIKL
jgi:hypothetical protein